MISGFQDKSIGKNDQKSQDKKDQKSQDKKDQKSQEKNNQQLEIDILIICKDTKTIIQIESKKKFDEFAKKDKMKAFDQLDNGYKYFNSKIPFLAEHGWQYVKVAYFEEGWNPEENCEGCDPYVLTKNFDISEWLKKMRVSDATTKNKTVEPANNFVLRFLFFILRYLRIMNISPTKPGNNSTDLTYIYVLKFIFYQMYQHEDCITQDDLLQLTERNIEAISLPEKVLFLNKVQLDLLNTKEECKRVAFMSQFGTGKTTILKTKAKRLLEDGQKVAFIVFKDMELRGESLLFQSYKKEFKEYEDKALFIEISNAGSTVNQELKRKVKENLGYNFIMDEVPIGPSALSSKTLNEISQDPLLHKSCIWFACQSKTAPNRILLEDQFNCPEMPHALRYSANILKITKAIKDIHGGTSFPSKETNPDIYFNRGPRTFFFTLKKETNLACAVEQVVYILEKEKARTLIKIDLEQKGILQEFEKSAISTRLIVFEDPNVTSTDIMNNLTEDKILVVTSKDNGFIRGFEFSILVHLTQMIVGDQVELIYSRCKSKLIIVCNEDLPKKIIPNNASCDFAKMIPVHGGLMPRTVENAFKDKDLEQVLSYINDCKRPLPIDATNKASQTGLMLACISGITTLVVEFLGNGANPDAIDAEGWAPIHHASQNGDLDIVKKVDEATLNKFTPEHYKLSLSMKTNKGESALHIAAEVGRLDVVQHLLGTNFFNVNDKTNIGFTPLHLASSNEHSDVVRCLVNECKADVNLKNYDGWTPLHFASLRGHSDVVRCLVIECKADVNLKNDFGSTPLHDASRFGHSDVVRCLVNECKADVNLKNKYGDTPLHLASRFGRSDVVRCLVNEFKADVNLKKKNGSTPLHLASSQGHSDVVRFLVNDGKADVNLKNNDGDTPLHFASRKGHSDVVKCLVNEGKADVNLKDYIGSTPLHYASFNGHSDVVRCLVNDGKADVNLKNKNGWTPLNAASFNGHSDVIRCLVIEGKAKVNLQNKFGRKPIDIARNYEIESFLESKSQLD